MARSEHEKQWRREHRQKANVAGRCAQCCVYPREESRAYCSRCLEGQRRREKLKRREAGRTHKCTQCFAPCEGRAKTCGACRAKQRTRHSRCVVEGVCTQCKNKPAAAGKGMCLKCAVRTSHSVLQRKKVREAQGLCRGCGAQCEAGQRSCPECLLKVFAAGLGWSRTRWRELQMLFERQEGRCALTGVQIFIRGTRRSNQLDTASLDHIVPASKGGTSDISNLQWTSWLVNRSKTNLNTEEFLGLCTMVVLNGMRKDGVTYFEMEDMSAFALQEIEDFDRNKRL